MEVAFGQVGVGASVNVNASKRGLSGNYTICCSRGLYSGCGLEGSTFIVRGEVNNRFYARKVTPMEILSGEVPTPPGSCQVLLDAIAFVCKKIAVQTKNDSTRPVRTPVVSSI